MKFVSFICFCRGGLIICRESVANHSLVSLYQPKDDAPMVGPDRCVACRSTHIGDLSQLRQDAIKQNKGFSGMRMLSFGIALVLPNIAMAHIGHVGELAGHGHLIGLAALGLAGLAAAIGLRGADAEDVDEADTESAEEEAQEA